VKSEVVVGGVYTHYKGKQYRVLGTCKHSETLEDLVYYECLYENDAGRYWVRPVDLFTGSLVVDGQERPRFALTQRP
jgi:hypothetical protein